MFGTNTLTFLQRTATKPLGVLARTGARAAQAPAWGRPQAAPPPWPNTPAAAGDAIPADAAIRGQPVQQPALPVPGGPRLLEHEVSPTTELRFPKLREEIRVIHHAP